MPAETRTLRSPKPIDPGLTYGILVRGRNDPSTRLTGDTLWRAMNTPAGAATYRVRVERAGAEVTIDAWGPGRAWIAEHAPGLTGVADAGANFAPAHPIVAALHRRHLGLRLLHVGCVLDVAVPTILEQRVTSLEARRSFLGLVRRYGTPAPQTGAGAGRPDLLVPPTAARLVGLPDWEWRGLGVEGRRSETVRRVARGTESLDRAAALGGAVFARALRDVPGVGPWTAAHLTHLVDGDADAVPVGDWHLPRHVAFALAREPRADDARMLELLEPFRPHRARVWRLLLTGAHGPPRRAPRAPIHDLMRAEIQRSRAGRRPAHPNRPHPSNRRG